MSSMDNRMDAIVLAALMSSMGRKHEVSPLTVKITLTPQGISSSIEASKKMIEDFHAEEWLKETQEKLDPIMKEQTRKFAELFKAKFHLEMREVENPNDPMPDFLADMLRELFGGGRSKAVAVM